MQEYHKAVINNTREDNSLQNLPQIYKMFETWSFIMLCTCTVCITQKLPVFFIKVLYISLIYPPQ